MTINHPLAQTLERARLLSDYLKAEIGAPSGGDWLSALDDFAPGAAPLETLITTTQARLRTTAPAIVASAILQSYQWPLISTAIACLLLDRRVPDLRAANTLIGYSEAGEADALALHEGRFTALPDDPAAAHPDATVVSDLATLRATLRSGIEMHLGAVIDQLCARLGVKPRGLWLAVADSWASTLIWLMQEQNPAATLAQIEAEVTALIRAPGSRFHNRQIGLIQLNYQEHSLIFLDRTTCCYWYKTVDGDYCNSCPKRTREDRAARIMAYMVEKYANQGSVKEEETLT